MDSDCLKDQQALDQIKSELNRDRTDVILENFQIDCSVFELDGLEKVLDSLHIRLEHVTLEVSIDLTLASERMEMEMEAFRRKTSRKGWTVRGVAY